MLRKDFIKTTLTAAGMLTLGNLKSLAETLEETETKMPVLFVGHGSPMNAIEDNEFSRSWKAMAKTIPMPKAILFVSAHWLTRGTLVTAMQKPKTIHDFGGFPKALFDAEYPAPGNPELAKELISTIKKTNVLADEKWGLDHGTWSVALPMYPQANIPTLQLSIDYYQPASYQYELAKELASLRKKGVLIIGSGNMVHNLGMGDFGMPDKGFDWAVEMNEIFKKHITEGNHRALIDYEKLGKAAALAIPTPDHYFPLLYSLALQEKNEPLSFFNDKPAFGAFTMTSVKIG